MANAENPIYLVLDGHSVHRSKRVREFVEHQGGRLKIFILPPYSPELNPDELVWNVVKERIARRGLIGNKETLYRQARSALTWLQRQTGTLINFFSAEDLQYITE